MLEVEREEIPTPRALRAVPGTSLDDLDLERVNDYIQHLNWPVRVETLKADLESARQFLERRQLVRDGEVTQLGLLVAGPQPEAYLGARSKVRLETLAGTNEFTGSLVPVLEASLTSLLRLMRTAPGATEAEVVPVPDEVLRQAVHNAIAHRDYTVNKPTTLHVSASGEVTLSHPGRFSPQLLLASADPAFPLRGILPAIDPPNPWLTGVLHVFRKWDGRRVGTTTLLHHCLTEQLDLPFYQVEQGEVGLTLRAGTLLDPAMEARLHSMDAYLESRNGGQALTREQQLVLAYLMNSEWAHRRGQYTLLLTAESPLFADVLGLARAGLVVPHPNGTTERPLFVPHRLLMQREFPNELEARLGPVVQELSDPNRKLLSEVYRQEAFSKSKSATASRTALCLWSEHRAGLREAGDPEPFQEQIRRGFNRLKRAGLLVRAPHGRGYVLNGEYGKGRLF